MSRFWADESGATAVELGLLVALITLLLIGALTSMGGGVKTALNRVAAAFGD